MTKASRSVASPRVINVALCFGARAVLIGRAYAHGLAAAGEAGSQERW